MSNTCQDNQSTANISLAQLTQQLDAMHIAQLTSFAYSLPPLYFCREYLEQDEQTAIGHCVQRLENGISNQDFTLDRLTVLLAENDYYDDYEARLRLGPEPV
ncbi:hypothetical protein [Moritella viscosa]|uniref:Orphan protein n=1 Tax=Moritella viscosa TaxID=80854 RepID=A0ABY1HBJ9_9GAMM|nr:hypothetical protein [Moritella viscosa]SGY84360.1 Putative uncharacterized protein [Moritella viscosa]SGY86430.1 Putative uncharacterized protein [Moritella viscosa]SHO24581.1 Putative uncharacterized protein [Moritella viscosa]